MRKLGKTGSLVSNNIYEFILISDIYDKDDEGNLILNRKNVKYRYTCPISDITGVEESISDKGRRHKDKCVVNLKDKGNTLVLDSYETIQKLIIGTRDKFIGFKNYE